MYKIHIRSDPDGLLGRESDQFVDFALHSCAEKHNLRLLVRISQYLLNLCFEAHVQQSIRLVQNDDFHLLYAYASRVY